ncbi:MAG: hypothetical protein U0354_08275 [Candidatus Sericytochromatia bacterium]
MTNISVGNTRINFKDSEPKKTNNTSNTNNVSSENVKLRGITWNENVNRIDELIKDRNNVTKRDNGVIPSGNELPELFSDNSQNNELPDMQDYSNQNNNYQDYSNNQDYGYGESKPQTKTQSSDEGAMSTGIGMAIGAVGGGILGKKYGMTKWGIAIGTAIGGFIGNKIGK